ncbi:protein SLX4IP [Chanos chanos]|uniref:Protein SLX4IP n=1 Tax=Chanos chanos TaxID=29144 RepID=A0A6J2V784_CHACN|nr:protein SLX4IP [Chanos chanos]
MPEKCGNFAVLVDLHVLPLGGQNNASWFSQDHKEEVTAMIRDAVDQRVKQFLESRRQKGQPKQKKDLSPANPLCLEGEVFHLAAYFLKRHVNLRCIAKRPSRELRVFPERFIICVSLPECDAAMCGNPNLDLLSGQSRSEYFSGPGETLDPLNSSTITKRTALQRIVRQANAQAKPKTSNLEVQGLGLPLSLTATEEEPSGLAQAQPSNLAAVSEFQGGETEAKAKSPNMTCMGKVERDELTFDQGEGKNQSKSADSQQLNTEVQKGPEPEPAGASSEKRGRGTLSSSNEDQPPQEKKSACHEAASVPHTENDTPRLPAKASARSSASGLSACCLLMAQGESVLEEELLTHGKQAPSLPLSNSNTELTNQNRLDTSLRGLSVKPASSGSSIGSRLAAREEGRETVPRTSRLRRLKKS